MNEERMRELYARSTARRAESDPPCEVSLERMLDVLERRGTEEERRQVLAEVLRSPACREEFELLRAVVRASRPVKVPRFMAPAWRWAAAVAVVVGLGTAVLLWRGRGPEPLRGGGAAIVLHSPTPDLRSSTLPVFTWGRVSGALEYRFELLDRSGQVVYADTVSDTSVTIPPTTTVPAGRYLWLVVAQLPNGQTVKSEARGLVVN